MLGAIEYVFSRLGQPGSTSGSLLMAELPRLLFPWSEEGNEQGRAPRTTWGHERCALIWATKLRQIRPNSVVHRSLKNPTLDNSVFDLMHRICTEITTFLCCHMDEV